MDCKNEKAQQCATMKIHWKYWQFLRGFSRWFLYSMTHYRQKCVILKPIILTRVGISPLPRQRQPACRPAWLAGWPILFILDIYGFLVRASSINIASGSRSKRRVKKPIEIYGKQASRRNIGQDGRDGTHAVRGWPYLSAAWVILVLGFPLYSPVIEHDNQTWRDINWSNYVQGCCFS